MTSAALSPRGFRILGGEEVSRDPPRQRRFSSNSSVCSRHGCVLEFVGKRERRSQRGVTDGVSDDVAMHMQVQADD